jgi:GDP-L-fucose synthase
MRELKGKTVLVTGGSSMIGSSVVEQLAQKGANVVAPTHEKCDLTYWDDVNSVFDVVQPEYVIHCAGWNGGIRWNQLFPAEIFRRTALMALHVLDACQHFGVKKVVSVLTSCAYPDLGPDAVLSEKDFWAGLPNPSVECHGFAKRILDAYSRQLYKQHGLVAVCAVLNNAYGPRDKFDPERSKVLGAFVKKFADAAERGDNEVVCWGTGQPRRELIYRDDAAAGLISVLEEYEEPMLPINVGLGYDIPIHQLAWLVARAVGFNGQITWDTSKPDGQMKKLLDVTRMRRLLTGFDPQVTIHEGIDKTVAWYREHLRA